MAVYYSHPPQTQFARFLSLALEIGCGAGSDMGDKTSFGVDVGVLTERATTSQGEQNAIPAALPPEAPHAVPTFQPGPQDMDWGQEDLVPFPTSDVMLSDPLTSPLPLRNQLPDGPQLRTEEEHSIPISSLAGLAIPSASAFQHNVATGFEVPSGLSNSPCGKEILQKAESSLEFESPPLGPADSGFGKTAPVRPFLLLPEWNHPSGAPFADAAKAFLSANLSLQPYMTDSTSLDEARADLESSNTPVSSPAPANDLLLRATDQQDCVTTGLLREAHSALPLENSFHLTTLERNEAGLSLAEVDTNTSAYVRADGLDVFSSAEVLPYYFSPLSTVPTAVAGSGSGEPFPTLESPRFCEIELSQRNERDMGTHPEAAANAHVLDVMALDSIRDLTAAQSNYSPAQEATEGVPGAEFSAETSGLGESRTSRRRDSAGCRRREGRDRTMNMCVVCGNKELHIRQKECRVCKSPRQPAAKK